MKKIDERGAIGPIELVLIIAILAIIGFVGYRIYQTNENNETNNTASSTETEKSTASTDTEESSDSDDGAAAPEAATQTQFTATVGKFNVTLPENFVVIKKLDGMFEGGPATSISFATKDDTGVNVYSNDVVDSLSLYALPIAGPADFDGWVSNTLINYGDSPKQQDSILVDGADAVVYKALGLEDVTFVIWTNNGINYRLTGLSGQEDVISDDMQTVIDGFSFTD